MFEFLSKLFNNNKEAIEHSEEKPKQKTSEESKLRSAKDTYTDRCSVCGFYGEFHKNNRSFREGYQCPECNSSLRYRGQAASILKIYGKPDQETITDLSKDDVFSQLTIYEPGVTGPFRKLFSDYKGYKNSFYWDDVEFGEYKDGIQCQSLENLTFEDNEIDLIISSDIMEHVRLPWIAFEDIYRVLKPGGYHVFSIPVHLPMRNKTSYRVDTSGAEDINIEEPHYHGNGVGGKSLVYTDFGADIEQHLKEIGFNVELDALNHSHSEIKRLLTFVTKKTF
ncbi:methyltransferase domain-containing protein [Cocleimonas sp. KMM 6892]|uniref:class I SAM-dependent methyltransferase n=1 Tax=unclassified Cocleimonas TaxID=2639732 RepID=UPI002DBEA2BD|nr:MULTISPECIES: methyltransferase domain-containing protein [unclassified Cocleimonas]MEB8430923.1 methyltransferase domain-containing protein [Cocleimonas sp. KMM 6892]MEC4714305.1 methyltransferase domain-containing protein [Cocleimonas sp. KMM 6895]MEC4743636.1 methyltransferase domain-containing protein [Cocleimonas sp. KMM 6896]